MVINFKLTILTHLFVLIFCSLYSQNSSNCGSVDTMTCYSSEPFPTVNFDIEKKFESSESTMVYQSPLLGDVDGDCKPEIIIAANTNHILNPRLTSGIRVVDGETGVTKVNIPTAYYGWDGGNGFVLGDVTNDGNIEFIIAAADHNSNAPNERGKLICYDIDGNIIWISDQNFGSNTPYTFGGTLGLADFNQDGVSEVYIYNEIFNAQNGIKLCDGGSNGVGYESESPLFGTISISIAGQLDNDPNDLELAAGYSVYKIDITNTNGFAGNTMTAHNIQVNGELREGYTSIGDIDQDGQLDIIVSSSPNQFANGVLYVYNFDGLNTNLLSSAVFNSRVGPALIGDVDGSGSPELVVTKPYLLEAYKYDGTQNLSQFWQITTNDVSGRTGITMFDFNQNNIQEIVYRDETDLRVINGTANPPTNLATFQCASNTGTEIPIVGDLDNSGSSKICLSCATDAAGLIGRVEVFGAPTGTQPWAPSRNIWNQYAYHVFNVNDDLTIPSQQLNNATQSGGSYNNFYVQSSLLDENGNFLQQVPDLSGLIHCVNYDVENEEYEIIFDVFNEENASLIAPGGIEVSFFDGNPETNGTLIDIYTTTTSILPGDTLANLSISLNVSSLNDLYMVINNNGSSTGSTYTPSDFGVTECNYLNNILYSMAPEVIEITDTVCEGTPYSFDGNEIYEEGTYFYNVENNDGCDSLVNILNLNVILSYQAVTSCDNYTWDLSGQNYDESGIYYTSPNGMINCPDSITLDLTINNSIETSSQVYVCNKSEEGVVNYEDTTIYGCDSTHTIFYEVYPDSLKPVADFRTNPMDSLFLPNNLLKTINLSQNADIFYWNFGETNDWVESYNSEYEYTELGEYIISLIADNSLNCPDTLRIIFQVKEDLFFYAPNSFTPDGNGVNENFKPSIYGDFDEFSYQLTIFNRWGEIMFESYDLNYGWNGQYGGRTVKDGTYVWKIEFKRKSDAKRKEYVGHVNVLK